MTVILIGARVKLFSITDYISKPSLIANQAKEVIQRARKDPLFLNSIYLILTAAIMSGVGFLYWIIAAHFYSPASIGYATALISITALLSGLSMVGLNTSILHYLPNSKNRNLLINTCLAILVTITLLVSIIYALDITQFNAQFKDFFRSPIYVIVFIFFMVATSVNTLTDSIFTSLRSAKYNLIVYSSFSVLKTVSLALLVALGSYGIIVSFAGSVTFALIMSLYFLRKKFAIIPRFDFSKKIALQLGSYSIANYAVTFLAGAPMLILPSLILLKLGAEASAYYYMASTIAALFYVVPQAISLVLLSEASQATHDITVFMKKSFKLIALLLIPAIILTLLLSSKVLSIFGATYSINSARTLNILAISSIFLSINTVLSTVLRVQHRMRALLLINTVYAALSIALLYHFTQHGIETVAIMLLVGQGIASIMYGALYLVRPVGHTSHDRLRS